MAKSSRPMGYVYPKKILRILQGDWAEKTFIVSNKTEEEKEKLKQEKEAEKIEKEKRSEVLVEARFPSTCPVCKKSMMKRLDKKYYYRRGICMDCVIRVENYLRATGIYNKYEEAVALRNYKAFLLDVKEQAIDFLENLKDEIKIVNHDGTFDTLKGDVSKIREFISNEIKDMDSKLEEVSDVDMNISAEQEFGINFKELAEKLIKKEQEKNAE